MFITWIAVLVSPVYAYVKLIKLYTLNMCSLCYIDYAPIKWKKNELMIFKKNKDYVKTRTSENFTHVILTTTFVKTQALRSECAGLFLAHLTNGHCYILISKMV